jgi:hypothetical protein
MPSSAVLNAEPSDIAGLRSTVNECGADSAKNALVRSVTIRWLSVSMIGELMLCIARRNVE